MSKPNTEDLSVEIDRGENRKSAVLFRNENPVPKRSLGPFFGQLKMKRDSYVQNKGGANSSFKNPVKQIANVAAAEDLQIKPSSFNHRTLLTKSKADDEKKLVVEEAEWPEWDAEIPICDVSENVIPAPVVNREVNVKIEKNLESNFSQSQGTTSSALTKFYNVLWAKASTRKHKKWEGDGVLYVTGKSVTLKSLTGKVLDSNSNYKMEIDSLEDGKIIKLGGKEIEIQELVSTDPLKVKGEPEVVEVPQLPVKLPTKLASRPFVLPCAPRNDVKANADAAKPMFDPCAPDALVMPQLETDEIVEVVVDPHLTRHLRSHQREGVVFLYRCVMGRYMQGAILADEMGLGKTLQCITLLWTVMKQTPYGRKNVVKRSLIVAPSSLVSNWENEFNRWLGTERIRVYAVNADHPLKHYPPQCPVLIISYDMATRSEDVLKRMKFDLMICDEAHKIKNANGQAYKLLHDLDCTKRIILTGTPIQNDLMELHSLVDFVNPGVLGKDYEFRKNYERPIAKFQERNSIISEAQCFEAMQLNAELKGFFLRRSHDVMARYLPPKVTSIVICKPTDLQKKLYERLLSSSFVANHMNDKGSTQSPLSVILALKKICNHPSLVHPKNQTNEDGSLCQELTSVFPSGFRHDCHPINLSGKLKVLVSLLKSINASREKVVLVSHYTKTLDVFEEMCNTFNFKYRRLDGTTASSTRQDIVDQFNDRRDEFLFLLSSKAGGVGLNLQGASNIILYDIDWNPAHDIQAMARCWRPGQTRKTHIYRLLTGGTIEEKMFHRQITKMSLSGSVMDLLLSNSSIKFSPEELKDIFTFHDSNSCLTHDLLECDCMCDGSNDSFEDIENIAPPTKKTKGMSAMGDLAKWEHYGPPFSDSLEIPGLLDSARDLQFVFRCQSSVLSSTPPVID